MLRDLGARGGRAQPRGFRAVWRRHAEQPADGVRHPDTTVGRRAQSIRCRRAAVRGRDDELERVQHELRRSKRLAVATSFSVVSAGADAELSCDAMSLSFGSPVQVAWVTNDVKGTETALTGLLGVKKWVRLPDIHFAPETCSYLGGPADFVANISL